MPGRDVRGGSTRNLDGRPPKASAAFPVRSAARGRHHADPPRSPWPCRPRRRLRSPRRRRWRRPIFPSSVKSRSLMLPPKQVKLTFTKSWPEREPILKGNLARLPFWFICLCFVWKLCKGVLKPAPRIHRSQARGRPGPPRCRSRRQRRRAAARRATLSAKRCLPGSGRRRRANNRASRRCADRATGGKLPPQTRRRPFLADHHREGARMRPARMWTLSKRRPLPRNCAARPRSTAKRACGLSCFIRALGGTPERGGPGRPARMLLRPGPRVRQQTKGSWSTGEHDGWSLGECTNRSAGTAASRCRLAARSARIQNSSFRRVARKST